MVSKLVSAAFAGGLLLVLSLISTATVYIAVYAAIQWVAISFGATLEDWKLPVAITGTLFVTAFAMVIRKQTPNLMRLRWDSETSGEAPSSHSASGAGGRLWNVNALGPQSLRSVVAIGSWLLCLGPSLALSALQSVVEELRRPNS